MLTRNQGNRSDSLDATLKDDNQKVPRRVIDELGAQLEGWRDLLPAPLQWLEDARNEVKPPAEYALRTLPATEMDVPLAVLRARFYYAKFILRSPFLYLALHQPAALKPQDASECLLAFDSILRWPLSAENVSDRKRHIPHYFTWTQSALSFLCIFATIASNKRLKDVCERQINLLELRVGVAVQLCWLKEMKAIDCVARWAWQLLSPLFVSDTDIADVE